MHFRNSCLTNKVSSQNDNGDTRYTGFNANLGGDCQSCFKCTDNDEILHVHGAMVDKIVSIADPLDLALASLAHYSPGDHNHDHCRKVHSSQLAIIKGWERLCLELSASMYCPTRGPILDAFWRTAFLDRNIVLKVS